MIEPLAGTGTAPLPGHDPQLMQAQLLAYARDLRVALDRARRNSQRVARNHVETVAALAAAVEVRDAVTGGHVLRVANYGTILAEELAPELRDDPQLVYGFLLHDIGKMAIPDSVLRKPGALDDDELRVMRSHVEHGIRFVKSVTFLRPALSIIATHHEHVDGSGYPQGLRGDEIPLAARMFLTCDAFDAMIHDRPYRPGMSPDEALAELRRCAGTQFDPEVVEAFERSIDALLAVGEHPEVPDVRVPEVGRPIDHEPLEASAVFSSVDHAMVLLSPAGTVFDANRRFLDLFRLAHPPIGMRLHEVVERAAHLLADTEAARRRMAQLERDMFAGRRDGWFTTRDGGRLRWLSNLLEENGVVSGRVVTLLGDAELGIDRAPRGDRDVRAALTELAAVLGAPDPSDPGWLARAERARAGIQRIEALVDRLEGDAAAAVDGGDLPAEPE